ncbi:hypothetical protein A3709_19775 [Halioglobus sp. HI00S01]|uniref:CheR family methyltransferase n=1 Tax=Halioglobus sp. HI00S01 TaxID=1822214 RepID=UPI0007C364E8|nr:CheR family methyltransferase [Halioglobus sp. HI00S01]KZX57866.1 hypothetical protein A3709_19775 [Halioglobus sp. HI00S01]
MIDAVTDRNIGINGMFDLCERVQHYSGISYQRIEGAVESAVQHRAANRGMELADYVDLMLGSARASSYDKRLEWHCLIDEITVNDTRFFRDSNAMRVAKDHMVEFSRRGGSGRYYFWSLGCSTGAEVYSLAMLCESVMRDAAGHSPFLGFGSDISTTSVEEAKRGVYIERLMRNVSRDFRRAFFNERAAGVYEVNERLRANTAFFTGNIKDTVRGPFAKLHLIYCQNVLVYFDDELRFSVLDALVDSLAPGGLLIVSGTDPQGWNNKYVRPIEHDNVRAFQTELGR